ncbi:MAG TPA: hypothetical protein VFO16_14065 [Pseudonocardiaceae bacterium]|nr:hypothetical protein [Pseudonocardiaceae bacterium]
MKIQIIDTDGKVGPPGKVADAELYFEAGQLAGLKLIGFGIWERRYGADGYNVTFPARQYAVNGERRSFALLRPADGNLGSNDALKNAIVDAYRKHRRGETDDRQDTPQPAPQPEQRYPKVNTPDQDALNAQLQARRQPAAPQQPQQPPYSGRSTADKHGAADFDF